MTTTETCARCFKVPGVRELGGPPLCPDCRPIVQAEYDRLDSQRPASERERKYGLEAGAIVAMMQAQGGRCKLCPAKLRSGATGYAAGTAPQVDHCHDTGRVRGLLCARCNSRIRPYERDRPWLLAVLDYLAEPEPPQLR